jgi:putative phosphoesterase
MRLGILSDIHDHLHLLHPAIEFLGKATDLLLCCGDLCSPFVVDQLQKYPGPVHIVFGNNDADLFRITRKSNERVQVHGELLELKLEGFRVAVNHYDNIAAGLSRSGLYDLVCYGHNHRFRLERHDETTSLNPGAIMGAAFGPGGWEHVPSTFATFDTVTREARLFRIDNDECVPHTFAPI